MRIMKEHRARAAEYETLSRHAFKDPELQKRYADLADDFNRMASTRSALLAKGLITSKLYLLSAFG